MTIERDDGQEVARVEPDETPRAVWPEELQDALGEIGTDGQVAIYRVAGGKREYIDTLDVDAFSLDAVRDAWGPGRYQARLKGQDGTWKKSGTFSIADVPRRGGGRDAPPAWVADLVAALRPAAPVPGEGSALKLFAEVSTLAQAQTMQMMTMIEKLTPKGRGGGISPAAMADLVLRAMEMGADQAAGAGSRGAGAILAEQMPRVLGLIERAAGQAVAPEDEPAAALATGNGAPGVPEDGADPMPIPIPARPSPFAEMAPFLPRLLQLADADADVEMWAITLNARFPELVDVVDALAERMGLDRIVSELSHTFPKQLPGDSPRLGWFRKLVSALVLLREEEAAQADGVDE